MKEKNGSKTARPAFILAADGKSALEKCAICRMCELVCSLRHFDVSNPRRSRITVAADGEGNVKPQLCIQCPTHPCVSACPREALVREPLARVYVVDAAKCDGCRGLQTPPCMQACPVPGALRLSPEHKLLKCDLCGGEPACIKTCYAGVLKMIDRNKGTQTTFKGIENISKEKK